MSANDEFPRGLTLVNTASNPTVAAVTFLGFPGISWVLTSVTGFAGGGASAVNFGILIPVWGLVAVAVAAANSFGEATWTGEIVFPPGQSVLIDYNGQATGAQETIEATAYPI